MPITVHSTKVLLLALSIPTATITIIRLLERWRRRSMGLDDAFAGLSLVGLVLCNVAVFLHFSPSVHFSHVSRVAIYYVLPQSFYLIIWSARLSMMFMIIRISFPYSLLRYVLYTLAATFVIIWAILIAQVFWVCERMSDWKNNTIPQCPLGLSVAIAQLISDIYADSALIIAPLRLLWKMHLAERRRLLLVFSSSIVTTITSLVHAYYLMRVGGITVLFLALIEICSSLFVCNLAIVVPLFSRMVGTVSPEEITSEPSTLEGWGVRWIDLGHSLSTFFGVNPNRPTTTTYTVSTEVKSAAGVVPEP